MEAPTLPLPVEELAAAFGLPAAGARFRPLGSGRINHTYLAEYPRLSPPVRRVHQRLNPAVFQDPAAVMENLERVTRQLRRDLGDLTEEARRRRVLTLVPARDGRPFYIDAAGGWWRTFHYVENALSHDHAPDAGWVREAARAFARFSLGLADLPPPPLHETLPGFHDTPHRLVELELALQRDVAGRAAAAAGLGEALLGRRDLAGLIPRALADGAIPTRICHNDTKLNNVLFDAASGEALCVVDLDTVMPGTVLHDFGDLVRSTVGAWGEDDDPESGHLHPARFDAAVDGYLGVRPGWLTAAELELLAFAPAAITLELAARFLADFLRGDRYFPVRRPDDNLRRARRQFRLLAALERHQDDLARAVRAAADGIESKRHQS